MNINTQLKKLEKSQVEITGEIAAADFASYEQKALKHLGEHVEIDGFRKGHIPENVLLTKIPEINILEEMAEIALAEAYPQIIEEHKIDAIGRPEISLTKIAKGNPLGFKIITGVIPEVTLPDYKKIAHKAEKVEEVKVEEEEMEKTMLEIRKMRAQKPARPHDNSGAGGENLPEAEIEGEKKEVQEKVETELPPLDDAFVQTLGSFNTVEDFKMKLRENIKLEKENRAREKRRIKIVEGIISESKIDMPKVLIDSELDKMLYRLKTDVENIGFSFEDYLKQVKKTEEEIRKEWELEAEKRSKLELIIQKISEVENIKPDEKDVEHELSHLLEHYKDADKTRARIHVESTLITENVFKFLENQ